MASPKDSVLAELLLFTRLGGSCSTLSDPEGVLAHAGIPKATVMADLIPSNPKSGDPTRIEYFRKVKANFKLMSK